MKKILCTAALLLTVVTTALAADKKIVFVAGKVSHGPGDHEFRAGCLLLAKCLEGVKGVQTEVVTNGWPQDEAVFDGADAIIFYMDGGANHPVTQGDHLAKLDAYMKAGVGLGLMHYAVEPTVPNGQKEFIRWVGGAFETNWSVNPHWTADFQTLPKHPVTRGVHPFESNDEWYFHMRFAEPAKKLTPLLAAVPPAETMNRGDGPHQGNPAVREAVTKGEPQTVAWAYERAGGGRGFGFTGGHRHTNWADDNVRKFVLNAALWLAHKDVPKDGVVSQVTPEDLQKNLDDKGPKKK